MSADVVTKDGRTQLALKPDQTFLADAGAAYPLLAREGGWMADALERDDVPVQRRRHDHPAISPHCPLVDLGDADTKPELAGEGVDDA
ncbi:hypothetical protein [Microtetraspora malaysiensis]|uniref:hypothetical protein n=1 Tax=Microtetraspora malaysiensis TaxID=161358 RepID=UPI003D8C313F